MPILAAAKNRVGIALHDNLILADTAETKICVLLTISTCSASACSNCRERPG